MFRLLHKLFLAAGLVVCLLGASPCMAAQTQEELENQEFKTGIHGLRSEQGAYLLEHILTDYFNGSFLTVSDGRIIFCFQVLKDGQLVMEGCYITEPKGTESSLLALDGFEPVPRFRRMDYSPRNAELKAVLDKAYLRARQEEARQQGRQH